MSGSSGGSYKHLGIPLKARNLASVSFSRNALVRIEAESMY
jgi:hypothetical protein